MCQLLTDEKALAAAMVYVELNPVRANELLKSPDKANYILRPIVGLAAFGLPMIGAQHIQLID